MSPDKPEPVKIVIEPSLSPSIVLIEFAIPGSELLPYIVKVHLQARAFEPELRLVPPLIRACVTQRLGFLNKLLMWFSCLSTTSALVTRTLGLVIRAFLDY